MDIYASLIEQYQSQIQKCESRIKELEENAKREKCSGQRDELYLRIRWLHENINDLYDSIHMMKKYAA